MNLARSSHAVGLFTIIAAELCTVCVCVCVIIAWDSELLICRKIFTRIIRFVPFGQPTSPVFLLCVPLLLLL